jgi:hypothetical protein
VEENYPMGVPDVYKVSRIAEGRSMQRAIAASALAVMKSSTAERVLKATWPRDQHAELLLRGAQTHTKTTDFISSTQIGAFRSIAPGSTALRLSDIKVPHVASVLPKPLFV